MDFKPKKLYSPAYNLLFDIITILSDTIFILMDKFVNACIIPHWLLLFDSPLSRSLSLVLVYPALNLCIHMFASIDFVVTFCVPYTTHILLWLYMVPLDWASLYKKSVKMYTQDLIMSYGAEMAYHTSFLFPTSDCASQYYLLSPI